MSAKRIHIIANSHMDPVWVWNRSSGRANVLLWTSFRFHLAADTLVQSL